MAKTVLQIEERNPEKGWALFELGFRPFFLLASLYAALSAGLWMAVYFGVYSLVPASLPATYWHAHEMVFGFGVAVVAGFLLTVVHNWTGIPTIRGGRLALLVGLWLAGRLSFLLQAPVPLAAAIETVFGLGLLAASAVPLYRAGQWRNLSIFGTKVVLLILANLAFYLGMAGWFAAGLRWGLYTGLYLLVALIFTMGRRVIPFFIEKGVGQPVRLRNSKIADLTSMVGLLGLWLAELWAPLSSWTIGFALVTAAAQVVRLFWWHAPGLWRKPMIWVLWGALAWVTAGLLIKAYAEWQGLLPFAAWHAISYGGIGMVTLGMMARASLGHTGRSVFDPPRLLGPLFLALAIGAAIRSLGPLVLPDLHHQAVAISQLIWILVFVVFFLLYLPIWIGPSKGR